MNGVRNGSAHGRFPKMVPRAGGSGDGVPPLPQLPVQLVEPASRIHRSSATAWLRTARNPHSSSQSRRRRCRTSRPRVCGAGPGCGTGRRSTRPCRRPRGERRCGGSPAPPGTTLRTAEDVAAVRVQARANVHVGIRWLGLGVLRLERRDFELVEAELHGRVLQGGVRDAGRGFAHRRKRPRPGGARPFVWLRTSHRQTDAMTRRRQQDAATGWRIVASPAIVNGNPVCPDGLPQRAAAVALAERHPGGSPGRRLINEMSNKERCKSSARIDRNWYIKPCRSSTCRRSLRTAGPAVA